MKKQREAKYIFLYITFNAFATGAFLKLTVAWLPESGLANDYIFLIGMLFGFVSTPVTFVLAMAIKKLVERLLRWWDQYLPENMAPP